MLRVIGRTEEGGGEYGTGRGGALDFLKGREEHQFLSRAALYKDCARRGNLSAAADNGDTLTIEYTAMDENFCTVFYTLQTVQPMEAQTYTIATPTALGERQAESLSVTVTWSPDKAAQAQAKELAGLELCVETYVPQEGADGLIALTK